MALKKIIIIIFLLVFSFAANSAGGRELAVTQIAPSARALALGNAYAAHIPDAASFLWNPGGLAFIKQNEISTIQTQLSSEVDFFGLNGVVPLPWCNIGIYWAQLQIADIPETAASLNSSAEVEILGRLTYYENAAVLAIAKEILPNLGLGIGLRQVSQKISEDYGYGAGWSSLAGLYYHWRKLTLGLTADNINAYQEYDTGHLERLPQIYTFGLGWQVWEKLGFYYDRRWREDVSVEQNYTGLEFLLSPRISLAVGCLQDRFTAGAGLIFEYVYFNYAYAAQNKNTLGSDQYISLGVRW